MRIVGNLVKIIPLFVSFTLTGQGSMGLEKVAQVDAAPSSGYNDIWGYDDGQGKEYAIIGSRQRINIYDITDCTNPVLDTFYSDGANTTWRDFKTYQHYVYGVCDACSSSNIGLEVIDMNTGVKTNFPQHFKSAHNIFVEPNTGRLYAVGVNGSPDLIIYDLVANPAVPTHLATIDFGIDPDKSISYYIHDIFVRDTIAYMSMGYSGYGIYNVADPTNPQWIAGAPSTNYNHSSWLDDSGQYAYVAYEVPTGVPIDMFEIDLNNQAIIDKGNFQYPLLPNASTGNRPHNPFIKGDSLFISYYHDGLQVFDITNKLSPQLVAYYDTETNHTGYGGYTGLWGVYPYSSRGCIIGSDLNNGLFTFEFLRKEARLEGTSIVIENFQNHLVFRDGNGQYQSVTCDINGQLFVSNYVATNDEAQLYNTDIYLPEFSQKIYFKTGNQDKYRYYMLDVDANNNLQTSLVNPPADNIIQSFGPLLFDTQGEGFIMRNATNKRVKVGMSNAGSLQATDWHPGMN